jgi:hypothetical protein
VVRFSVEINSFSIGIVIGDAAIALTGLLLLRSLGSHVLVLLVDSVHGDGSARFLGLCPGAAGLGTGFAASWRTTATVGVPIEPARRLDRAGRARGCHTRGVTSKAEHLSVATGGDGWRGGGYATRAHVGSAASVDGAATGARSFGAVQANATGRVIAAAEAIAARGRGAAGGGRVKLGVISQFP